MNAPILAAMAVLVLLSAFFSSAETAFSSLNRVKLKAMMRDGHSNKKIERALALSERYDVVLSTVLIGNNLASVAYSSSTAALAGILFAQGNTANVIWSFGAAFALLYMSEFLPKLLCAARPLRRSLALAPAYRVLETVMRPLTALGMKLTDAFVPRRDAKYKLTSADLLRILQDRKDGVCLSDIESALVTRIIVLRVKGRPITPESILSALRDDDGA